MEPDIYALSKAGISKEQIEEIVRCGDQEIPIPAAAVCQAMWKNGLGQMGL